MADALGSLAKAAIKKDRGLFGAGPAIAYPETPGATDMAAGEQIAFSQENLKKAITRSIDPNLVGAQSSPAAPVVAEPCAGPLTSRARWRSLERLFLFALGFELPNGDDGSPKLIGTGEGTKTVTDATNATPIVVSVAAHGYSNGDGVRIAGVTGNTAANGDWAIAGVTGGTFELVDSSGNAAYISGGSAEKYNAAQHLFEGDETLQDAAWDGTDGRNPGFDSGDRKVRRFQLAFDKQVSDHNFYSSYITKLTLSGDPSEVVLSVDVVSYNRLRGSYNSTNWTLPVGSEAQVLFRQLTLSFGTRAGGEGALTVIRPSSFELAIDNLLAPDDQTSESGVNHEIPVRDNFRQTMLKLEFPRYSSDTFGTALDLDVEYAAKLIFAGPAIGASGANYAWEFFMSSLRWNAEAVNIPGPGRMGETIELFAEKPGGSDIFAAGNYNSISLQKDSELVVIVHNEDPQNYLTEY